MNNVQPLGGWFDDAIAGVQNFFSGTTEYTPTTGLVNWGETLGQTVSNYQSAGQSDSDVQAWTNYFLTGGVMGNNSSANNVAVTNTGTGSDVFANLGASFNNILSGVTNLFGAGVNAYATVQQLINAQNPSDVIVNRPELGGAVVQRTQNGQVTYVPLLTAYPQFASQIGTANKSSNMSGLLIAGALGLGLVLILKKK
ncbi:MAG: hypothetical protein EBT07_04680 [Actinobacteria bacterium]|nr:hypothetical protein [Actinomycetota bacterium]